MVLAMATEQSDEDKAARLPVGVIAGSTRPGRQSRTVAEWVWRDKPVAFVGYGLDGGTGAVEHLRATAAELGMAAVGPQVAISLRADYADGRLAWPWRPVRVTR